jgi:hypothetical protein
MQTLGSAPEALSQDDIIRQYSKSLEECITAASDPQNDFERQILINQARLNVMFVKGQHFNVPGQVDTPWGQMADYVPFDSSTGEENGADVRLCPPINFVGGDCYKYMAVMGNTAPRVKAVADDPHDPRNIDQAHNADANIRDLWNKNKVDRQWKALAFHQYATGPSFIRGQWKVDGQKYGQTVEPKIDLQDGPDGIPSPMESPDPEIYENGDAEMRIYSVLEVTIPFTAKSREDLPYLDCEEMRSKFDLLHSYPDKLEQYRTGELRDDDLTGASNTAHEAREATANPSGTGRSTRPNQWRFREFWRSPMYYEAIQDSDARDLMKRQYPEGLYVAKVGGIIVRIDNRKITDEWAVCKVGRGELIMERPICADIIPLQRAINDLGGWRLRRSCVRLRRRSSTRSWLTATKWRPKRRFPLN